MSAIAVQPDGKIVLAGATLPQPPPPPPPPPPPAPPPRQSRVQSAAPRGDGNQDFVVARLTPDGALDTQFGTGGIVRTPIDLVPGGYEFAQSVALAPDGKIVLAGISQSETANDFAVVRYTSDGALDSSFSGDGIETIDVGTWDLGYGVTVQPADEKIVVVGQPDDHEGFAALRLQSGGGLDGSFGDGGIARFELGNPAYQDEASGVALTPEGKVVIAGTADDEYPFANFALARLLANGELDPSFGDNGIVITDKPDDESGGALTIAPDGKLIVGGSVFQNSSAFRLRLERYLADGTLDSTFGDEGVVTTDMGINSGVMGVTTQADGKLIASAHAGTSQNLFGLARYLDDGSLDPSFGDAGTRMYEFTTAAEWASGVAMQPVPGHPGEERIIQAGWTYQQFVPAQMAAIRVHTVSGHRLHPRHRLHRRHRHRRRRHLRLHHRRRLRLRLHRRLHLRLLLLLLHRHHHHHRVPASCRR